MDGKSDKKPVKRVKTRPSLKGVSELTRMKHKAGLEVRKELEIEDPFETGGIEATPVSVPAPTATTKGPLPLKDKYSHDAGVLKSEWSLFGGELMPDVWLVDRKGYSEKQAKMFIGFEGESAWLEERSKVQNAILEKMAKRNVDIIVEKNEYFQKFASLGLMKATEMMAKNPSKLIDPATGKFAAGISAKDLNELGSAAKHFQEIWLKAMGINPKDNVGITNVFNQLKVVQVSAHGGSSGAAPGPSSTTTITAEGATVITEGKAPDPRLETMNYDEMATLIEAIRSAGFTKDEEKEDDLH